MYSKDEASRLKQAFWTAFGLYITPQMSAEGLKINWVNYRTGIKYLNFKMYANNRMACIAIEMSHSDPDIQELIFEQFTAYRNILHSGLDEEWEWQLHTLDETGKTVSRIYKVLEQVSILRESDWPALISFFKPRIIALDEFWTDAQYGFELFK
jgi:hypothetical protein